MQAISPFVIFAVAINKCINLRFVHLLTTDVDTFLGHSMVHNCINSTAHKNKSEKKIQLQLNR